MTDAERRLKTALRKIEAGERAIKDRDRAIGDLLDEGKRPEEVGRLAGLSARRMAEIAQSMGKARPRGRPRKIPATSAATSPRP